MKCEKCDNSNSSNKKLTKRTEQEKKNLIRRLNIIEGQVKGIKQMIEDDRYCDDVLIQIAAISKAIKSLGNNVLENHLRTCVVRDIKNGNTEIIDDVMCLIKKLQ